ncbi:unnamed protein product [Rotaria magnacalcarata]|uniref:Thioredoxin domain-containing protein n=1 Tax=Rotaria magnacalcarata TaxID=392030 RepID=A0A816TWA7_9BILA|nr:unnamed protein product [Rotaria magnacalcarata]CAF1676385.1 unnamed protein product [Rotaria magnacalcarata]CAF2101606.1 unnamed protein product [Rotaria magnacalcarata]CAF3871493.1 unnamed protein product [Rotaria magnacalcarata]CAF3972314.1 unnamed protein product [Rotaria magnacalcarata]
MAGVAKLFDGHILHKSNQEVNLNDEKYRGKIIGIYFSAHWCPPCRGFTPILIDFYKKHKEDKNFEIIFVSSDNDEESFNDYYKDMPWWKLDYKERGKRNELASSFKISGIPALILLDGDSGKIICNNGREQIQFQDKNGENFPWKGEAHAKASKPCILL